MSSPIYSIQEVTPNANEATRQRQDTTIPAPEVSGLANAFNVLAALQIVGGIGLCIYFWPGQAEAGYVWLPAKYLASVTWLVSGIISGCLFLAISQILTYLKGIYSNTYLQSSLGK